MIASGSIIILKIPGTTVRNSFVVENFAGKLLLAQVHNPYARLHISERGLEYRSNTPQGNNLFTLQANGCNRFSLVASLRDKSTKAETTFGLSISAEGVCGIVDMSSINPDTVDEGLCYEFDVCVEEASADGVTVREVGVPVFSFEKWQLRRLLHEGFLRLENTIDSTVLEECIAAINHELGFPGRIVAGGIQEGEALGKLAGNLSNCAAVRNVLTGKAQAVLNAAFGADNYENSNLSAQIALRFPELNKPSSLESSKIVWHTDGLRQGHSHGFSFTPSKFTTDPSLLLGVCLSDVESDFCGNFTVWPGSHLLLHQCKVPPHGALDLHKLHQLATHTENAHFSNFAGMLPPELGKAAEEVPTATTATAAAENPLHNNVPDLPSLGVPLQLKLRKGDVVLAHPDLAHAGAPNYSSAIRHMLFFRIKVTHSGGAPSNSSSTLGRSCSKKESNRNAKSTDKTTSSNTGGGGHENQQFSNWDDVVQQHAVDMWADLPVLHREVGRRELEYSMQLYVPEYRSVCE